MTKRLKRIEQLRDYVAEHGVVPPLSTLADLWGYASKSAAARLVDQLVEERVLERAPDRRLRPGPGLGLLPAAPSSVPGAPAETPAQPHVISTGLASISSDDAPLSHAMKHWLTSYDEDASTAYLVVASLLRFASAVEKGIRENAETEDLRMGDVLVLDALYRQGPPFQATPTELKNQMLLSLAGVGKRVDRVVELGLVERAGYHPDGRRQPIRLTDAGLNALRRLVERERDSSHMRWALTLQDNERSLLINLLRRGQSMVSEDE